MAVLPFDPRLAVDIVVNDRVLYVEAESGAEFSIRYIAYDHLPSPNFAVYIYLDGKEVESSLHQQHNFAVHQFYHEKGVYSELGSQTVCQHYKFSDMVVVEDNIGRIKESLLNKVEACGIITVMFQGACNTYSDVPRSTLEDIPSIGLVPEKALKGQAKTHTAALTEPRACQSAAFFSWDDAAPEPFAVFNFKYRSKTALQALRVIPREPTPVQKKAAAVKIKRDKTDKRKRAASTAYDSDATDDFGIVEARNKRRCCQDPREAILID